MSYNNLTAQQTHKLKIWPEYFDLVESGKKPFEVRKLDRDFKVGDILHLEEFYPSNSLYSGRETRKEITYILVGGQWGIEKGNCVIGLAALSETSVSKPQQDKDADYQDGYATGYFDGQNDKEKELSKPTEEGELFNYCVGRYWKDGKGAICVYTYGNEVHYGTASSAQELLRYVNAKDRSKEYKIFKVVPASTPQPSPLTEEQIKEEAEEWYRENYGTSRNTTTDATKD